MIPDSAVTRGEFLVYVIDNHAAYIVIRLQHVEKHCAAAYKRLDICNIFPFTEPCRKKCPELRYKLAFTAHPLQKRFSLCHYCIALCKDTERRLAGQTKTEVYCGRESPFLTLETETEKTPPWSKEKICLRYFKICLT